MSLLLIAGSPTEHSRSAALLDATAARLDGAGLQIERINIRDLDPRALLLAEAREASVAEAVEKIVRARVLVIATPVYKAAYSGLLKVFLDLLQQNAFQDKLVLPLATGGSPHHMLALDYALRPVLQSLSARHIFPGVYATDTQVVRIAEGSYTLDPSLASRLDSAAAALIQEVFRMPGAAEFAAVPFAQVRCSV